MSSRLDLRDDKILAIISRSAARIIRDNWIFESGVFGWEGNGKWDSQSYLRSSTQCEQSATSRAALFSFVVVRLLGRAAGDWFMPSLKLYVMTFTPLKSFGRGKPSLDVIATASLQAPGRLLMQTYATY